MKHYQKQMATLTNNYIVLGSMGPSAWSSDLSHLSRGKYKNRQKKKISNTMAQPGA
jgi:hypothetical protein